MRTRMYGGVRGRKTKVGEKLHRFSSYSIYHHSSKGENFHHKLKKVHFFVKFFEILTTFSSLV